MKTQQPLGIASITAAANLTAGYFIGFDGAACGANAKALGVCEADTDSGRQAPVITDGIAVVICGGTISVGDPIASDASGKAVAASALAVDDTKLTIDSGATAVTSSAANGAIISAAAGFLAGSTPPVALNGWALDAGASGGYVRVKLV